jgi:hypothetical protein
MLKPFLRSIEANACNKQKESLQHEQNVENIRKITATCPFYVSGQQTKNEFVTCQTKTHNVKKN